MENYIHVKIFILWTLVISTLANEWTKILSPSPNPAQMVVSSLWAKPIKLSSDGSLFFMGKANKTIFRW